MNKRAFFGIVFSAFIAISNSSFAIENRGFEAERLELCKQIQEVLLLTNQCTDPRDCIFKQLAFCSPARDGVGVQLWGVENGEAIEGVLNVANRMFVRRGSQMNVYFKAYRTSKAEALNRALWGRDDAFIEVDFQRNK